MATDLGEEEIERVRAGIWRGGTLDVIGGGRVGAGPGGWRLGFLLLFDLVSPSARWPAVREARCPIPPLWRLAGERAAAG